MRGSWEVHVSFVSWIIHIQWGQKWDTNGEIFEQFSLNCPKNFPKRVPAGILQKVTGIVFAEAETADQKSGTYSQTEKRCGSLWI